VDPKDRAKQRETVGLIGIGLLGSALAERFLTAGWDVIGYDVDLACRRRLAALGGRPVSSPEEVARSCSRLVLSLPTSSVVAEVLDGLRASLPPDFLVADTTTGDPEEVEAIGDSLAAAGVHYLDATVGGSSRQVWAGEAIVLVGGEAEAFERCRDLFGCFARKTFYLGPCGSGARIKLVLNLVLGLNRAVLAEGLSLAEAIGLEPAKALEVLREGPAYSRVMDTKGRKMLIGDFEPEARLSQHLKDVRLILEAGRRRGARLPFSKLHRRLLEALERAGCGGADNSAVIKAFQPKSAERKESGRDG